MTKTPLIILGASGNAADILDIVDALNAVRPRWVITGLLDDKRKKGSVVYGRPVVGKLSAVADFPSDTMFINAIGSDRSYVAREQIVASTGLEDRRFATLIHPGAAISAGASLGPGSYACFGVSAGHNVRVGGHVHLGVGAILGHDTSVDDYALIAPGAVVSGFVRIGKASYIGAGAVIKQLVEVGDGALVGLGAVVIRDVASRAVVAGNPARPLLRNAT